MGSQRVRHNSATEQQSHHRLWLGLLQSWAPYFQFHSCPSTVSFQHKSQSDSVKTKVSSCHICPDPSNGSLCLSGEKPWLTGPDPLLPLASPPTPLSPSPQPAPIQHTGCSVCLKMSSPEYSQSQLVTSIRSCSDVTFSKKPTNPLI